MGEWEVACDDGANDFAAGAVCRSMGWRYGRVVSPSKTMDPLDLSFGWVNVQCNEDDTLMMRLITLIFSTHV